MGFGNQGLGAQDLGAEASGWPGNGPVCLVSLDRCRWPATVVTFSLKRHVFNQKHVFSLKTCF